MAYMKRVCVDLIITNLYKDTANDKNFRKLPCNISINVHDRDSLGKGKLQKHTGLMGKISF